MTVLEYEVAAPPEQVFAVLADGWSYAGWVVGASRMRDVDAHWPAPGSRIHHSVGVWPVLISDVSVVEEVRPGELLLLEVRFWPVGHGRVRFTLRGHDGGTAVTMEEWASGGPARVLHNALTEPLVRARNRETLRRLAWLAERRES
jgi:uncharacterized protein YndB with AHSA1/START domain